VVSCKHQQSSSSVSNQNQPMDTTATSLVAQRVKQKWTKKQEMGAALVTAYAFPVPLGTDSVDVGSSRRV
jgi:hypothetical protein